MNALSTVLTKRIESGLTWDQATIGMRKRYTITANTRLFGHVWIGSIYSDDARSYKGGTHFYIGDDIIASIDDKFTVEDSGGRCA